MRKSFFSIAAIIICITIISCKDNKERKEKDVLAEPEKSLKDYPSSAAGTGTFSITAPGEWIKRDTVIEGTKLTTITSPVEGPEDNFKENVNVVTEAAKGYDYNAYAALNLKTIKSQMPDINILSEEEIELDGMPAKVIIYTLKYGNYSLKNTAYMLVKNDIGYVITCTALQTNFNKFQPAFTSCVNSFEIDN